MHEPRSEGRGEVAPIREVVAGGESHQVLRLWRQADPRPVIEERVVIATPEGWAALPESSDPSWKATLVELAGLPPVVLASRLDG